MKRIWNIPLFAFFIFCLFLFRPRQDVVFTAISKSQYIRLFEMGMDFELSMENNTFTGTYTILNDTVYLSYRQQPIMAAASLYASQPDFRKVLPRKLYINESTSDIQAADGKAFSAKIFRDFRQKQYQGPAYSIRVLKDQSPPISGIEYH